MHQYRYFISCRYSTFTPFSTRTFFLLLGFTLHRMSTNLPSIFSGLKLFSGKSAFSYSLEALKKFTSLPLCASTSRMVNKASREMVGEDASYLVIYHCWGRLSAHILPFSFPLHFAFYYVFKTTVLISSVILWGYWGPGTWLPSYILIVCIHYTWPPPPSIHAPWFSSLLSSLWMPHLGLVFSFHA